MRLKTKNKIALARWARNVIATARTLQRAEMTGCFRRGGLEWWLDLNEGIDFSIFLLGAFERSTVDFYRKVVRAGDTVFDIGANIGAHALPFAQCVGASGKVHAFEPTEFAYSKLLRNLSLNPQLKRVVIPNHVFLTSPEQSESPPEVYSSWPLRPVGSVHEKHLGKLKSVGAVTVSTLDSYCLSNNIQSIDWIKIDVDGNELAVLRGGLKTLVHFQPKIIMELSPYICREAGYHFDELVELLTNAMYRFYDIDKNHELPSDSNKLDAMIADGSSINVVLKPFG